MGIKFLRDGIDSANFVAMYSVDGQVGWNYFENDFSNHIARAKSASLIPVAAKFSSYTDYVQEVGLSDMAKWGQDGTKASPTKFPFSLRFHPTGNVSTPDTYIAGSPFTDGLMAIPAGTTLYEVYAMDKPSELGGYETLIAEVVLTSTMSTSMWGDKEFFVRHQDMKDDLNYHPEWEPFTAKFSWFGEEGVTSGCPYAKAFLQ